MHANVAQAHTHKINSIENAVSELKEITYQTKITQSKMKVKQMRFGSIRMHVRNTRATHTLCFSLNLFLFHFDHVKIKSKYMRMNSILRAHFVSLNRDQHKCAKRFLFFVTKKNRNI